MLKLTHQLLQAFVKSAFQKLIFIFLNQNISDMLWVLKRAVLMRWFLCVPTTYVKTDGLEHIYNFSLM